MAFKIKSKHLENFKVYEEKSTSVQERTTKLLKVFNTFLSVTDRKLGQKYHEDVEDLSNILHKLDPRGIYGTMVASAPTF